MTLPIKPLINVKDSVIQELRPYNLTFKYSEIIIIANFGSLDGWGAGQAFYGP